MNENIDIIKKYKWFKNYNNSTIENFKILNFIEQYKIKLDEN